MVNKIGIAFFTLIFTVATLAQEPGVKWFKGSLDKAMEAAKKEDKIVFIDFYADWCAPCKMLDKMVWQDADSARQIKAMKVIPMKMDAEKEGEEAAVKYKVKAYPTILFLDREGKEISRTSGFRDKEEILKIIRKNCEDTRSIDSLRDAYGKNQDDIAMASILAKKLISSEDKKSIEEAKAILEKIFKADPENKRGAGAQALIDRFSLGLEELENVQRRLLSLEAIKKALGADISLLWDEEPLKLGDLQTTIKVLGEGVSKHIARETAPKLREILEKAEKFRGQDVDISGLMEFSGVFDSGNENLRELSDIYFDIAACFAKDATSLNEIAWHNYTVQRKLEESAKFAEKAVELGNDPNCIDTLAHIQMSLGMKQKAIEKEKEAIAILKSKGDDRRAAEFERILSLFEKNKLDQLAAGVEPSGKELKRAKE